MTTLSLPLVRRIQVLLNTLIGEHHVRRSLLVEVCELMRSGGHIFRDVHEAAAELLLSLDRHNGAPDDFDGAVKSLATFLERAVAEAARPDDEKHAVGL
jgi:hypothetical protein